MYPCIHTYTLFFYYNCFKIFTLNSESPVNGSCDHPNIPDGETESQRIQNHVQHHTDKQSWNLNQVGWLQNPSLLSISDIHGSDAVSRLLMSLATVDGRGPFPEDETTNSEETQGQMLLLRPPTNRLSPFQSP